MRIGSLRISIHAPAKGATSFIWSSKSLSPNFNPRSREGSDNEILQRRTYRDKFQSTLPRRERRVVLIICFQVSQFQSTLPRRERLILPIICASSMYFNPRSREGSDYSNPMESVSGSIFQSTLPRRERLTGSDGRGIRSRFQSTLPRRERLPCQGLHLP